MPGRKGMTHVEDPKGWIVVTRWLRPSDPHIKTIMRRLADKAPTLQRAVIAKVRVVRILRRA